MGRSCSLSDSNRPFLEPPHRHDPTSVSILSTLPSEAMRQLPENVRHILSDIQESTCVAYASFERLEDLIDERFERLMPSVGPKGTTFSESSWFNYSNQFQAEHDYLVSEAIPDWHQKASSAKRALQSHFGNPILATAPGCPASIGEWWNMVHRSIATWLESARQITLPEFDDIVQDYLSGRHDAAVFETPDLSPIGSEQHRSGSMQSIHISAPALHFRHEDQKALPPSQKIVEVVVKSVDLRKDSGISMATA